MCLDALAKSWRNVMDNEIEIRKRCSLHAQVTAVITHVSPGEELMVREDGSFYDDSSSIAFDITKMTEAEEAAELILDTAHWYEAARRAVAEADAKVDCAEG